MLYFRFVANAFVLGVVEVKLGEASRIVKRKQEVRRIQYSLRCIGEFDVTVRQMHTWCAECIGGLLLVKRSKKKKYRGSFDLLRVLSCTVIVRAW
jgi:rRNA maturation endonuclease Nob1